MMKILAISGSLRTNSSNTAILRALIGLAPDGVDISIYDGLADLPHFNPEIDDHNALGVVSNWRARLKESHGLLFCTPEYAHGVPGVLKNALDWIVSSGELMNKPTAVISASPSPDGGDKANASLVQTLKVMMAEIDEGTSLCIPAVSAQLNDQNQITNSTTEQALRSLLNALIESISQTGPNLVDE
jgi:chromate reductase, NAD(P)H dehydrogenase (quinone)